MKTSGWFAMLAGALLAIGCSGQVDQVLSNGEHAEDLACGECAESYGFASSDSCYDSVDPVWTDAEARCVEDVLDRHEAARRYFDCYLQAQGDALSCGERANQTCNAADFGRCLSDLATAERACRDMHLTALAAEEYYDCVD